MNKNVFISYGHGIYDDIVLKLANDIRSFGFNVFVDKDYLHVGDWENIINEHILASKYFIFMVSERSTSNDGYCLNELCRAGENNSIIIPVKLDESRVPLSINKYQRLSLIECMTPEYSLIDSKYKEVLTTLSMILSGKIELGFSDGESRLKQILKPISSKEFIYRYYETFCGRKKVFNEFEKFLKSDKSFLWINATPGAGKTALSSMFIWKYPEYVAAAHFCKFNNSDRVNPKNIITSIAYQLSNVIPLYKRKLIEGLDLDNLFEKNASRIFEYLLIEGTQDIKVDKPVVIIIDALDECSWRGNNEICSLLQRMRGSIPSWMKFVLTSRDESEIRRTLYPISLTYNLTVGETDEDLREFYHKQFPSATNYKIDALIAKSEGSFLYASEITKQIKSENLNLDDINFFPVGIYGFFNDCFSRIFLTEGVSVLSYDSVKPLLEFLCIAQEPTNIEFLEEYLKMDEYKLKGILAQINGLFPVKNGYIEPLHKSLVDWLCDSDDISQIFYISKKSGYKKLLIYIEGEYEKKNYSNLYVMKYFGHTLISLKQYEYLARILDDYEFQKTIIEKLEFDSGLEGYLNNLLILSENLHDECVKLLNNEAFIKIFSENRRLLYNSGMFFTLKKIGLSVALRQEDNDWGIEGEIGKVFYYYIVEDFSKAIKKAKILLKSPLVKDDYILKSEIYNVKGLSERKLVLFDDALDSFDNCIECAEMGLDSNRENSDIEFELSLAHLIKGKIYLHMLAFNNANKNCKKAIKILSRKIEEMPESDKKISNTLFLAEDYRVFADAYIWQKEYEQAEDKLHECEEIYIKCNSVDRYFIRYKYTTIFLKIMKNNFIGLIDDLKDMLNKEAKSSYDKGIINFYIALCYYRQYQDDLEQMALGIKYANNGADIFDNIDAILEKAECYLILELIGKKTGKKYSIDSDDNEYIDQWINYAKEQLTGDL